MYSEREKKLIELCEALLEHLYEFRSEIVEEYEDELEVIKNG